jgi:hypothetical protein
MGNPAARGATGPLARPGNGGRSCRAGPSWSCHSISRPGPTADRGGWPPVTDHGDGTAPAPTLMRIARRMSDRAGRASAPKVPREPHQNPPKTHGGARTGRSERDARPTLPDVSATETNKDRAPNESRCPAGAGKPLPLPGGSRKTPPLPGGSRKTPPPARREPENPGAYPAFAACCQCEHRPPCGKSRRN